jgi:hypothetical protein
MQQIACSDQSRVRGTFCGGDPMQTRWLILLALSATIFGCDFGFGPGMQDFDYPVAGNYKVFRSSAHQIKVVPSGGWSQNTPIIPTKVVEIAWDQTFVLVKQQQLRRRSPNNPQDTYEEPDPGKYAYWILDTSLPKVYGPLTAEEFRDKRAEMKINKALTLRDVYSYKH